ncbi:MAG TPA: MaoC/PaaZ C-terminal domain-containing protein [Acidimicrobiales bacterium]|jgi:acyl dehydratase|nr:MaoC/PaaZ C-terminal domain-containing protein [Acidimicrobiales bacterium]
MPIEVEKVVGAVIPGAVAQWDEDAVILYHLGVGAGVPPTDPGELQYTYESSPLKVLPSFGVIPVFQMLGGLVGLEGLTFNPMMLLHGEQDLVVHKPLPARAKVENTGRVSDVYDKGKGALVVVETETKDENGDLLCTNRFSAFIRGEGGFGGESGPAPGNEAPARDPDVVAESPTLPQQALLYRLSGDKNPLHVDPNMAALGGFDRPILHGLCSFGIVCKAAVDNALDGDVTKVGRYQARFSGVVFPGETIVTSMWREGDKVLLSATTKERGTPVITNAALTIKE